MYRTLWLALMLCLTWTGLAQAATVTDPEGTFSIVVPPGWSHANEDSAPDQGHPVYTVRLSVPSPGGHGFRTNVGIQILHSETKLTAATKNQFKQGLLQMDPSLTLGNEETVELGGLPAWKVSYSGHLGEDDVIGYCLLATTGGKTWSITFMTQGDTYQQYEPQVASMLKSFKLLKKP